MPLVFFTFSRVLRRAWRRLHSTVRVKSPLAANSSKREVARTRPRTRTRPVVGTALSARGRPMATPAQGIFQGSANRVLIATSCKPMTIRSLDVVVTNKLQLWRNDRMIIRSHRTKHAHLGIGIPRGVSVRTAVEYGHDEHILTIYTTHEMRPS
eukprot:4500797-Pyramimonas_sp.AAC.1